MPSLDAEALSFAIDGEIHVSGLLQVPLEARACLVLAHGAGAGVNHPFMTTIAGDLAKRGIGTLRYQFPYMEHGSKRPDPAAARACDGPCCRSGVFASGSQPTTLCGRQILWRPHDLSGTSFGAASGRPRIDLLRISPTSGGKPVPNARQAPFRYPSAHVVPAGDS